MLEFYRWTLGVLFAACIGLVIYTCGESNSYRRQNNRISLIKTNSTLVDEKKMDLEYKQTITEEWKEYQIILESDSSINTHLFHERINSLEEEAVTLNYLIEKLNKEISTARYEVEQWNIQEEQEMIWFVYTWKSMIVLVLFFVWSFVPSVTFISDIAFNLKKSITDMPSSVFIRPMRDGTYQVIGSKWWFKVKYGTYNTHSSAVEFCDKLRIEKDKKYWHKVF